MFLYFSLYCLIVLFGLMTTKLNKLYYYNYYYRTTTQKNKTRRPASTDRTARAANFRRDLDAT